MTTLSKRLFKDLSITFNGTPLTVKEIARYWKRNSLDVRVAAIQLLADGKLYFNSSDEMVLKNDKRPTALS